MSGVSEERAREEPRLLVDARDALGEGPHWCEREQRLYRVDILASAIHSVSADGGAARTIPMSEPVGAVVPRRGGGLLAATASGIRLVDAESEGERLVSPEADRPGNRFNDGKCDSRGRFWIGSLAIDGSPGAGALWRIEADGRATRVLDGVDIANGLGWSPDDRTFYFTDSGRRIIEAYAFDAASGELGARRVFARCEDGDGVPDGLAVDAEGFVWSARWDGGTVVRHDPDGRIERRVPLPVPRPTSCALGGVDGCTLFVTSARAGLSAETLSRAPLSGGVFVIDAPAGGLAETMFG